MSTRSSNPRRPNGSWLHDHSLSAVLFALFLSSWIAQLIFQYLSEVDEARMHGATAPGLVTQDFLHSFLASTMENWQSEFLQLFSFVVLATFLIHRGSPQAGTRTTRWPRTSKQYEENSMLDTVTDRRNASSISPPGHSL